MGIALDLTVAMGTATLLLMMIEQDENAFRELEVFHLTRVLYGNVRAKGEDGSYKYGTVGNIRHHISKSDGQLHLLMKAVHGFLTNNARNLASFILNIQS